MVILLGMAHKERKIKKNTLWQRQFLIITGIVELALCIPSLLFIIFFGYQGFVAGEMGNMIGLFSIAIGLFLLPYIAARAAAVHGLIKRKPWGAVISIILSGLFLLGAFFSAVEFPVLSVMVLLYTSVSIWAAVKYLGHTN